MKKSLTIYFLVFFLPTLGYSSQLKPAFGTGGGLNNVVEDTTPQAGGNFDFQNFDLLSSDTSFTNPGGILKKGGSSFLHNFNYGNNGTVITDGNNVFLGKGTGNLTNGATAVVSYESSQNTFLGCDVGPLITTAYNNTIVGFGAFLNATIGYGNTYVGVDTAKSVTSAAWGTGVGYGACRSNISGGNVTCFGAQSLFNSNGTDNTAIGMRSLYGNTTGSNNTALGVVAGGYITGGSVQNQTSTNSLYLGRETKALSDGGDNEIVIGSGATGNGSNTVTLGNVAIVKTFLKGDIEVISVGTTDVQIVSSGAGLGGRIILEDTDGAGCTAITAFNGVLTAAIVACP